MPNHNSIPVVVTSLGGVTKATLLAVGVTGADMFIDCVTAV